MYSGCRSHWFLLTMLAGATLLQAQAGPAVVSSADGAIAAAPGSLATLYGVQLSTGPIQPGATGEVATELGGFSVEVNGKRAQLLFVSPSQINFIMPADVAAGEATITVKFAGQAVAEAKTTLKAISPAIFATLQSGLQMGAILNAVTFAGGPFPLDTAVNPGCDKRTRLAIFATGLGLSAKRMSSADIQAELQDSTGARFVFAAESAAPAPGFAGLDQVNVVMPPGMVPGIASVKISVGAAVSNKVNFEVAVRVVPAPSSACLAGLSLAQGPGNGQFTGTVTLAYPAPAGGAIVNLTADANVGMASFVTVPEGQASAQFQASAASSSSQTIHVAASLNGDVRVAALDLSSVPTCVLAVSVAGSIGTVTLSAPAPPGKPFSGRSRQAGNLEQVGGSRERPNRASRWQYAEGPSQGRLDGLAMKVTSGGDVKAPPRRGDREPGGGEAQEGIGRCRRLNPDGAATDPGEEQGPEGGPTVSGARWATIG
jgi:uncharacterized protein (TIGR03437 family)